MISADLSTLEFEHRYLIAMRVLHISEKERMIVGSLMIDPAPWPIQTLSERIRYARAGVRDALKDLKNMGFVEEIPRRGWVITEAGVEAYSLIFEQCVSIGTRAQRGFTQTFVDRIGELTDYRVPKFIHIPLENII